ncbi:MAG TPA: HAD family hydrolase [Gemmatimonadales bacterium]|nr:HAD family hydrolase [Gemmatimonadales bacterium]
MTRRVPLVFLFDVDNTLLDNDAVEREYREHLVREAGSEAAERHWAIFEDLRRELGYADYLGALQRYRHDNLHDPRLLCVAAFLLDYPFASRLYPGAIEVLARYGGFGTSVILSDGDVVFQPRKIDRSGLRRAVDGRVLVYIHKEQELADVEGFYPADRYVLIDDKLRILAAVKQVWGARVTTVFVRQGHYAHDPAILAEYPAADVAIDAIGDLLNLDPHALLEAGTAGSAIGRTP